MFEKSCPKDCKWPGQVFRGARVDFGVRANKRRPFGCIFVSVPPQKPNPIPDLACWSSGSNSQLWKIEFLQKHLKLNTIKFEIAILDSAEHVQLETTRDLAGSGLGQREDTLDAVCDSKCYNLTQVFAKQNSKKDYLI